MANPNELLFADRDRVAEDYFQYKLLVLCSDEAIKEGDDGWFYDKHLNEIEKINGVVMNFKSDKKVIATNSPTITPNCYISEERVKEFVEYMNKYKELPKFEFISFGDLRDDIEFIKYNDFYVSPNNILQIKWLPKTREQNVEEYEQQGLEKWLPKEEERERGITITSLSSKILETKEQIFEYFENNYGWEFKKIDEYQIQLFKGFDFLYQYHSKENIETIHSIQHGFSFDLPINSDEINIVMKAFSIKHK
jgi:hypothetical protein